MRYLMKVLIPNEPFGTYVREGTASKLIGRVLEETKPETVYFTEEEGKRCAIVTYNIDSGSQVPSVSEPWFLTFNAECRIQIAMSADDLKEAKLDDLGKRWRNLK
jgi:hypothetical protein